MAPAPRVRPYKDFLTPALHRRFMLATATLLGVCYVESVLIGEWNSFIWSWFPFGMAGIRTGLLFIPALMIFLLRVAQLHAGLRTSHSAWGTFKSYFCKFETIQTVGWYLLSAYMFSEIYIWSVSKDADLNRIKLIPKTYRTMLNEKPIYLTSFLLFLALLQAVWHLFFDYDRIDMPVTKSGPGSSSETNPHVMVPPVTELRSKLPEMASSAFKRTMIAVVMFPVLYSVPFGIYPYSLRSFAWSFTRSWAKIFWNLPKSGSLPTVRPFHYLVLLRTAFSGFLLTMLWEIGNAAFSVYVAQEPLKNDRPITYESRDPNGSLLTGLQGKKLQTRAFAFWELVYISQRYQGRRKVVFEDIDRKGGSMWSQILAVCLEVINGIDTRITEYQSPPAAPLNHTFNQNEEIKSLPRLTQPLKDGLNESGDLFSSQKPRGAREAVGKFAKDVGQNPTGALSPKAKKLLARAEGAILNSDQRQAVSSEGFVGLFKEWITVFVKSQLGWPFRQEWRRRVAAIVLGSPYGDVGIIVNAINSLKKLAVCSLTEDKYGNVQRDVKLIIQTFTKTVHKLEAFNNSLGLHWSDVEGKKESPEADTILAALKSGLNELVNAFEDYSNDLRLSQSEMRMAREAAATPDTHITSMAENR